MPQGDRIPVSMNFRNHHHSELVHTVYLADLLMTRFFTGLEMERLDAGNLRQRMAVLGIGKERFPDLIDLIPVRALTTAPEPAMEEI